MDDHIGMHYNLDLLPTLDSLEKSPYLERLEKTGRGEGLKKLLRRHPDAEQLLE